MNVEVLWQKMRNRNLFACFSIAHLEDLQNQTIIFDNYSTIQRFRVSIITTRQIALPEEADSFQN